MRMTEIEGRDDLPEEPSSFLGREATLLNQIVEQFAARDVFQDEIPNQGNNVSR